MKKIANNFEELTVSSVGAISNRPQTTEQILLWHFKEYTKRLHKANQKSPFNKGAGADRRLGVLKKQLEKNIKGETKENEKI